MSDDDDIRSRTENLLRVDAGESTRVHLMSAQSLLAEYMARFEEIEAENRRLSQMLGRYPETVFATRGLSASQVLEHLQRRIERLRTALNQIEQHKSMLLDVAPHAAPTIRDIAQSALKEGEL